MNAVTLYVTAASREEALRLARTLVSERLVACANILPEITSVYRWEGEVREDAETALLLKTTEALVAAVTRRIQELHSYDCPCVVACPIVGGNPAYLQWVESETGAPPTS